MAKSKDLTNKRFGKLVALKISYTHKKHGNFWLCKCDCGNTCTVVAAHLLGKKKSTKSCGCLHKFKKGEGSCNNLYLLYKRSAKERNYEFNLTKDQFKKLTKGTCFYCGEEPSQEHGKHLKTNGIYVYNGIDRINNSIGYTLDNCVTCCWDCNKLKKAYDFSWFINQVNKIHSYLNSQLVEVET